MTHTLEDQTDLWHVEVLPNDVRVLSLEELDAAYQRGQIGEDTRVWQEGLPCAVRLGELLGEEDAPAPSRPASVPPSAPMSVAPIALDVSEEWVPRRSSSGKVLFGVATLLAALAGGAAFAFGHGQTDAPSAAAPPPPPPEPPKSHAYDPGNEPVHLGESHPITLTVREKTADERTREQQIAAANAKEKASSRKTKASSTQSRKRQVRATGPQFKSSGKGSKYDPLNGAL